MSRRGTIAQLLFQVCGRLCVLRAGSTCLVPNVVACITLYGSGNNLTYTQLNDPFKHNCKFHVILEGLPHLLDQFYTAEIRARHLCRQELS